MCASLIGICEEVPESIANAAAAVAAERFSNRPMSPPVVAAGAAASAPALMPGDGGMPKVAKYPTEEMWMELFMDPALYYDNRLTVSSADTLIRSVLSSTVVCTVCGCANHPVYEYPYWLITATTL